LDLLLSQWPRLIEMGGLLLASALFSGAETAFFSLPRSRVRKLREEQGLLSSLASHLLAAPQRLLISVLLCNLTVNVAYFTVAVKLSERAAAQGRAGLAVSFGAASLLALIFLGEFLPKGIALSENRAVARFAAPPLAVLQIAILPVRFLLEWLVAALSRLLGGHEGGAPARTALELKVYVRLTGSAGRLADEEREMLEEVIDFGDLKVKEVMVPRVDMISADLAEGREGFFAAARAGRVSKVVAIDGSPDRVRGFVAVKDLLFRPAAPVASLVREMPAVPETKTVVSLLKELRASHAPLALVVDEYGGTAGIVAPEDLLEEIVGEIDNEYEESPGQVRFAAPGVLVMAGDLGVREWEEHLGFALPDGKYETVAGFVAQVLGRIPEPDDTVEVHGHQITILTVRGGRVLSMMVRGTGKSA
jgi:putative hemolysin